MDHCKIYYYSHRFGGNRSELLRADLRRVALFQTSVSTFAPWIPLASAGVAESLVWPVIEASIRACDGIVIDLDGGEESPGMKRERELAESLGKTVEVMK
jgi:hypothetical protein